MTSSIARLPMPLPWSPSAIMKRHRKAVPPGGSHARTKPVEPVVGVDGAHPVLRLEVRLGDRDGVRRDEVALALRHLERADVAHAVGRDLAQLDVHGRRLTTHSCPAVECERAIFRPPVDGGCGCWRAPFSSSHRRSKVLLLKSQVGG